MKTLKKKDLVALIIDEYMTERDLVLWWHNAFMKASDDTILDYEFIIREHTNKATSLERVLIAYGYSYDELIRMQISNSPASEFVK